jgi:GntR family transcriptional regulator/MocR family aminotransferase
MMWGITLDRHSELPLKRQLYLAFRDRITAGLLRAGDAVPSTRELAAALHVSRNTVSEAYEMLIAEGYFVSRQGAPTVVADGLMIETPSPVAYAAPAPDAAITANFRTGRPDLRLFPRYLWQKLMREALQALPLEAYGYTGPQGHPALRTEIAAWLYRSRGVTVSADDIFITAGATHALHLICDLLCADDRAILMEDPCHSGMLQAIRLKGCPVVPIPADMHGLQTAQLAEVQGAGAVYVTPSHQFPLGGILPAARRAALIRFTRESDAYVIEDDYDSEFRYAGEPVAPLLAMDPQRVLYVGTFSKTLFPALRIGYAVVPRPLQPSWRRLRTHADVMNPPAEQAAVAALLRTRKFDQHIRRMRKIYGQRRSVLLDALADSFGDGLEVIGDAAGLHAAVRFPLCRFDDDFRKYCLANGIVVTPAETHCIRRGQHDSILLLGYGHLEPEEINIGVGLLHKAITGYFRHEA